LRAGKRYLFNAVAVQEALAVEAAKQTTDAGQRPQGVANGDA
jgi:hypothetical protein